MTRTCTLYDLSCMVNHISTYMTDHYAKIDLTDIFECPRSHIIDPVCSDSLLNVLAHNDGHAAAYIKTIRHTYYLNVHARITFQLCALILTLTVLVTTIDAQWEGMGDVGSARYEPALLPPCPTIRVLSCSN